MNPEMDRTAGVQAQQPAGCEAGHLLWSRERQDWRLVGELLALLPAGGECGQTTGRLQP